jgi:hypothetical protein
MRNGNVNFRSTLSLSNIGEELVICTDVPGASSSTSDSMRISSIMYGGVFFAFGKNMQPICTDEGLMSFLFGI